MPAAETKTRARGHQPDRQKPQVWDLRLYVAGQTPKSIRAFANLKVLCEGHLKGRYRIKVIDLLEDPQLARRDQIIAIPTLVRKCPAPARTIIGELSDTTRLLVGLDLRKADRPSSGRPA